MPIDPRELRIVLYPDPVLRRRGAPVAEVTAEVRAVAARMIELMREAEGIGLAAPQVGLSWRMFVADVPPDPRQEGPGPDGPPGATMGPVVYINPVLTSPVGAPVAFQEGCLSLPEITGDVQRPPVITITATDLEGRRFTQTGSGLLARCWQHEFDHIEGVLIIDRMTQMSRLKNRSALRDMERMSGAVRGGRG
jgi:peptide deformylase